MTEDQEKAFENCKLVYKLVNEQIAITQKRQKLSFVVESQESMKLYHESNRLQDKINLINQLFAMTDDERLEIINCFCKGCGTYELPCYCMRDD